MPVQRNIVHFPRSDSQKYRSLTFKMRFDRKEFLMALLPLLLFGFGTEASRKADVHCPASCDCKVRGHQIHVKCWNLTSIPHDLPKDVRHLTISGSSIPEITSKEGLAKYPLVELHLQYCKITNVHRSGLPRSLELLDLRGNLLTRINWKMFHRSENLHSLNLDQNRIRDIEYTSFPPALENLKMNDNELTRVGTGMFQHISRLKALYLIGNQIRRVDEGSFPKSVTLINMGNNKLTRIGREFSELPRLIILYLYSNRIRQLAQNAFVKLPLLRDLSLLDNRLTAIQADQFSTLRNLTTLNLYLNSIGTFHETALARRGKLKRLYLQKNPLVCDCHLYWLPLMLKRNNLNTDMFDYFSRDHTGDDARTWLFDYPDEEDIRCAHPKSVANHQVTSKRVKFNCDDYIPTPEARVTEPALTSNPAVSVLNELIHLLNPDEKMYILTQLLGTTIKPNISTEPAGTETTALEATEKIEAIVLETTEKIEADKVEPTEEQPIKATKEIDAEVERFRQEHKQLLQQELQQQLLQLQQAQQQPSSSAPALVQSTVLLASALLLACVRYF